MPKLTENQYHIKQYAEKYGITIINFRHEKLAIWGAAGYDDASQCSNCGAYRKLKSTWDEADIPTCFECFNKMKLPFYMFDMDAYSKTDYMDIPEKVLKLFKDNASFKEVRELLSKVDTDIFHSDLDYYIREFERASGYKYYPEEPYYTFIGPRQYNITFSNNEIHTARQDIVLSDEFRKKHKMIGMSSKGTYLIYTKWLKPMLNLQKAIAREEKKKERELNG